MHGSMTSVYQIANEQKRMCIIGYSPPHTHTCTCTHTDMLHVCKPTPKNRFTHCPLLHSLIHVHVRTHVYRYAIIHDILYNIVFTHCLLPRTVGLALEENPQTLKAERRQEINKKMPSPFTIIACFE